MLQIWFQPTQRGGAPAYFTRALTGRGRQLLAGDAAMPLRADARVWWLDLAAGAAEPLAVPPDRRGYLLAMTAPVRVEVPGHATTLDLALGDGLEVGPGEIAITGSTGAALWLDLG